MGAPYFRNFGSLEFGRMGLDRTQPTATEDPRNQTELNKRDVVDRGKTLIK